MCRKYFTEKQSFNQWWIILIVALVLGIWLWGAIQQLILGKAFGNQPVSDTVLLLMGLIAIMPLLLLVSFKMITEIRSDGVYYKMPPFFKTRKISKENIKSWHIRSYEPIKEYGGWGIRFSLKQKKSKAYNVKGKTGLQIELLSGRKILIGTQRPDELHKAMLEIAPARLFTY